MFNAALLDVDRGNQSRRHHTNTRHNTMTDQQILENVAQTIDASNAAGENWADNVDSALITAGVALSPHQPDGSDAWEIITLADDRTIYLSDESAIGAARYDFDA